MQRSGRMRVVEVQRVCQRSIEEGGAGWRVAGGVTEYAGITRGHPHGANSGKERRRALRVMPRPDNIAHQIEYQEVRALDDVGRQLVQVDASRELREFSGDAHANVLLSRLAAARW